MRFSQITLAALLLTVLTVSGGLWSAKTLTQAQGFDREAMLEGLVNETILPLHETLAAEAAELEVAGVAFQTDPNAETLAVFQGAWKDTSIAFEHLQVYRFQRVMPYMTQLDSSPPNIPFIEGYIELEEPGTINAEFVEFLGSSSKGLPALEYFIFGEGALASLSEVQNRRDYAAALAADIRRVADELVVEWTPTESGYGDRFISADGEPNSVRSSVSMLTNEMIAELEDVARFWLGGPLGYRDGGEPQPNLVEAPYSGTSTDKLIANLEGFEMALNGVGDAPSLADYLDFLGAELNGEPMSEVLNAQIETTIAALEAIDTPLQVAVVEDTATVEAAYNEAVTLLRLVKTDAAAQLGITVTFSDNDGD